MNKGKQRKMIAVIALICTAATVTLTGCGSVSKKLDSFPNTGITGDYSAIESKPAKKSPSESPESDGEKQTVPTAAEKPGKDPFESLIEWPFDDFSYQPFPSFSFDDPTASEEPRVSESEEKAETVTVLYYGNDRIGQVSENVDEKKLEAELCALLDDAHQPGESVMLKTESVPKESVTEPLTSRQILEKLYDCVKNEYTKAWALYIADSFVAAAESRAVLEKAVGAYLYERVQSMGSEFHAEIKDAHYESNVSVKKKALLSASDIKTLLIFCEMEDSLPPETEEYRKLKNYKDEYQVNVEILPVLVKEEYVSVTEDVPYETVYEKIEGVYNDYKETVTPGVTGKTELTYLVVYEDGKEVSRTVVERKTVVAVQNEVIRIGALKKGEATGSFAWPTVSRRITSAYGMRYIFGDWSMHYGIDIGIPTGTEIYAADGGKVTWAGDAGSGYGIYVMVDHGNGYVTVYAHMSKTSVHVGDEVEQGDLLGYSGATGRVTGPHLHFEIRVKGEKVDPMDYLPKN